MTIREGTKLDIYNSKRKKVADATMVSSGTTDRFENDVAKDEGDYGDVQKKYAPGPTYEQETDWMKEKKDLRWMKDAYSKPSSEYPCVKCGGATVCPKRGMAWQRHCFECGNRYDLPRGTNEGEYDAGIAKMKSALHQRDVDDEFRNNYKKAQSKKGLLKRIFGEEEMNNLLKSVITEAQSFDPKHTQHTEDPITDCAVCGKSGHVPAKHFGRALGGENNQPVKEAMTPISTSDVKHHPFAISAANNGYKHTGSWKDGGVQKHEFQHPSKGNLHLVNHGSDFWTAHVGNKQFRHSPKGADEVQKFHQHLGGIREAKENDPWRHVKAYTTTANAHINPFKKGTKTYTHPEGDKFTLHQNTSWTHFDKNGKKTTGRGIGNLQGHIAALHAERDGVKESEIPGNDKAEKCPDCGKLHAPTVPCPAKKVLMGQDGVSEDMKYHRQHDDAESAERHRASLERSGVKAWVNKAPDNKHHVFWMQKESEQFGKFGHKKGDKVKPLIGPHKGHPHEIIHVHDDGKINIRPIGLRANQIKYHLGAATANPGDVEPMTEEVVTESKKKVKLFDKNSHIRAIARNTIGQVPKGQVITPKKDRKVKHKEDLMKGGNGEPDDRRQDAHARRIRNMAMNLDLVSEAAEESPHAYAARKHEEAAAHSKSPGSVIDRPYKDAVHASFATKHPGIEKHIRAAARSWGGDWIPEFGGREKFHKRLAQMHRDADKEGK